MEIFWLALQVRNLPAFPHQWACPCTGDVAEVRPEVPMRVEKCHSHKSDPHSCTRLPQARDQFAIGLRHSEPLRSVQNRSTLGLSVYDTRGSRNRYIPWASLSVHTGPLYRCKEVAWVRASFLYSVPITRYVRINFVLIVNQTGGLVVGTATVPITRPLCKVKLRYKELNCVLNHNF